MNILASYPWIKEYLNTRATPEEFAREISLRGPAVEKILTLGDKFKHIVVGKLLAVEKHPNADKLRVCQVEVGEAEPRQIVCGGSNLAVGQLVAAALPGSSVRWHGEGELIVLQSAELRGVKSDGMICGADEIGLTDLFPKGGEKEVLDLSVTEAKPGTSVGVAVGLEDPVFDIEATTNRPDCFAILGLAREAGACGLGKFTFAEPAFPSVKGKSGGVKVTIAEKTLCPRYLAATVHGVKNGRSPSWMAARLVQAGLRPVNLIVDITNYVMLEYGHPLHAFDRAMVDGDEICVRLARAGETVQALDGKTYTFEGSELVIANKTAPMAIAGVMGGETSGTQEHTTSIVLEAAAFDPVSVRKTSRRMNLMTDAALRFEKGLSADACNAALARALSLILELCPSAEVTDVVEARPAKAARLAYAFRPEVAAQIIGEKIPEQEMQKILESLGFGVTAKGAKWNVEVPYWREHDIEGERDLVEEVARIHGYHNIAPQLPDGALSEQPQSPELFWEDQAKLCFEGLGMTEAVTYSMVNQELYRPFGWKVEALLAVSNPLSSDFTHLRHSLVPGLLSVVRENQDRFPKEQLFEIANIFLKRSEGELPEEALSAAAVSYGHDGDDAFATMKGIWEAFAKKFGVERTELCVAHHALAEGMHPGRTAELMLDGEVVGLVGELHPEVLQEAKVDRRVGLLSLQLWKLIPRMTSAKRFFGIPEFPSVKRDVSFVVAERTTNAAIAAALKGLDARVVGVEQFDEFRGPSLGEGKKSVAYHLEFRALDRTLETKDVDELFVRLCDLLRKEFAADVRS